MIRVVEPEVQKEDAPAVSFERVYRDEYQALMGLALILTGNRAAAQDLVHDAFFRLFDNWPRISRYEQPATWLRRVLINLATSRRRRLVVEARALTRLHHTYSPPSDAPVRAAEANELWSTVRRLPRRQAQILALYYGEDRSVAEIATILHRAEGTVRAHLHLGRQSLAAQLGTFADDLEVAE